jgi:hypothetical protein
MEIKLDSEAFAGIASAAIFESLAAESRELIIKQALQHLMTPTKAQFGTPGITPLQEAFNQAIYQVATKTIREKIEEDPEVNKYIYDMLGPIITPPLEATATNYDNGLSDALGQALGNWLGDEARKRKGY